MRFIQKCISFITCVTFFSLSVIPGANAQNILSRAPLPTHRPIESRDIRPFLDNRLQSLNENNPLLSFEDMTGQRKGSGNVTKDKDGTLYVYDAENRLLQMTKGTTIAKYAYDGLNRRISKEVGTAKTFYVHDGDEVAEERNTAGALVADYTYGPGIDEVLTMTRGANTYYYFYDALGSVRQITNAAGTISETYDYDVYGKPLTVSTLGNPVMFTGRWFDAESGLYYYRA